MTVLLPYRASLHFDAGRRARPPAASAAPRRGGGNAASPPAQCSASWRRRDIEQLVTAFVMDRFGAGLAGPVPLSAFQEVFLRQLFNHFCAGRFQAQQSATNVLFAGVLRGTLAGQAFQIFGGSKLTRSLCAQVNRARCSLRASYDRTRSATHALIESIPTVTIIRVSSIQLLCLNATVTIASRQIVSALEAYMGHL